MFFNSLDFWLVFPFIFGIYWLIPAKWNSHRKVFLVLASYLLYMNWKPAFALVLIGVTMVTYWGGYVLNKENYGEKKRRLIWLFVLLGLLPLLVFKYYNFINNSLTNVLATIGLKFAMPGLNWAVPVGISFFTFQAVGYVLDVYHGRVKAEKNLLDYVLFVSFFPQITSGPISMAEDLMPQIKATHKFDYEQGRKGLQQLLWGMFLKLVLADRLGLFVDTVYANYLNYNGSTCFVASIFYTLQIYCDFSGYSLMAIGIARTLGFNLIDNFRRPYFATSITDFWKRWHISLTRWLTRQVYIPLGGSRCSKPRTYWNIFVTFLVSGIWHGANWTFIVWGCMHGIIQIIEKAFGWQKYEGNNRLINLLRVFVTFILVNFAWVFFRMPTIDESIGLILHMRSLGTPTFVGLGGVNIAFLFIALPLMFFKDYVEERSVSTLSIFWQKPLIRWCVYLFIGFLTFISYTVTQSFIYFQF